MSPVWELDSGFKTDYIIHIDSAKFGIDQRYNAEAYLLIWTGTDVETKEPATEQFSVGSGWVSYDQGQTIKKVEGKQRINKSSMYGKLIQQCINIGAGEYLADRGSELQASVWEDLTFRLEALSIDFGASLGTRERAMPVELITEQQLTLTVPSDTMAKESVEDQLDSILAASSTFDEFLDKALNLDAVTKDDELVKFIMDSTDTGYWKQHKGE